MSVINNMLNDLDKDKPQAQIKEDVAFLEPKPEKRKPQRSTKWWAALVSSGISGVLAVVVGYMYYAQNMQTVEVLDRMQASNTVTASSSTTTPASSTPASSTPAPSPTTQDVPATDKTAQTVSQPKLVVLNNQDENGQPIERKSTLSVQQQAPVNTPSQVSNDKGQLVAQSNSQSNEQADGQMGEQAGEQREKQEAHQESQAREEKKAEQVNRQTSQSLATKSSLSNNDNESGQMTISKVSMSNEQRAQKFVDQGQKLAQQGLIQPSIDKYQQALNIYPNHLQGRLALAGLYYGRNMIAEALELLSAGLNIEPGNQDWSLLAAKIHYSRDNFAAALAYLQLPVHPIDNIEYFALKATTLQKLKNYQAATQAFGQLTVAYPESARWWLGLATSLEGDGKYAQAVDAYRQTLRLGSVSQTSRRYVLSRLALLER